LPGKRPSRREAIRRILAAFSETEKVSVAFDALKFAQTLRDKAKLSPEQAEGISQAFAEATSEQLVTKTDIASLATKADLTPLSARVDGVAARVEGVAARVEGVATKLDGVAARVEGIATKLDGVAAKGEGVATKLEGVEARLDGLATKEELKAAISDAKAELLKWMFGQTLLIIGVLMALLRYGH
jgi:hypothetical protein